MLLFQKLKQKYQDQVTSPDMDLSHILYAYLKHIQEFINLKQQNPATDQAHLLDFTFLCLALPYWRQHRDQFIHQMEYLLNTLQIELPEEFCQRLCRLQICSIDSQKDLYDVVSRQCKIPSGGQWRLIPDRKHSVVCLHLSSDKIFTVKSYLPYGVIYQGELLPLSDGTCLQYTPDMYLRDQKLHILKKAQNGFYFIKKTVEGFYVTGLSGLTYHSDSFDHVQTLEKLPQVFYGLKRLEQFFIDRSTDPYYKKLIHLLEGQIQHLESTDCRDLEKSVEVYEKIRAVFEAVFQDDKLLMVLLKQLNRQIDQAKARHHVEKDTTQTQPSLSPEWGL